MPGIVGVISKGPQEECQGALKAMLGAMWSEPFYTSGTYINQLLGLYCGWVGHKGFIAEDMPLWNEGRSVALFLRVPNMREWKRGAQVRSRQSGFALFGPMVR